MLVARAFTVAMCLLAAAAAAAKELRLEPCEIAGFTEPARCGTLHVLEDRGRSTGREGGRQIPIPVVVIPARGPASRSAIVFVAGGPGDSSVAHAAGIAQAWPSARANRDLLFVDTRGTGGPGVLRCDELIQSGSLQGFLTEYLPPDKVHACRQRLAKDFDLARYTTDQAADDLEEVRAALGYEQLDLVGASYGTRLVLVYLRRHPGSVRTATLVGVVPTDARAPLFFARDAQNALAATFAACHAEPACRAAFPGLAAEMAAVLARLEKTPAMVAMSDPATGERSTLSLTRAGFAQAIRYMLYTPVTAALVPLYVHQAAAGNLLPVAETARMFVGAAAGGLADGYYLSVTCGEDVPFITDRELAAATADTFLGDFRIRQQRAACAEWPMPSVAASFLEPVRSAAPVLMISGEHDPVTPPGDAERVAKFLSNSRHLIIAGGAHGFDGMRNADCVDRVMMSFIESGDAAKLDGSCITQVSPPPFLLAMPGADAPTLSAAELARFAGTYQAPAGLSFTVVLDGSRLRLDLPGKPPMFLTPLAADRFALDGLPPGYALAFASGADGAVSGVTLEEGAGSGVQLAKKP